MIDYYVDSKNIGIVRRITNNDGSTNHRILEQSTDNTDYQAYLKWLEESNTPTPADEVTA